MTGHAQLKFVMTECSKTQIRMTRHICMSIFPVQLENVRRIVIYLLTMAVHEHYVIIQCLEFNTHRTMKIGKAKHSFALHCAASKHTIILRNGKNKENKA